jgi:uncharacterized lipoprotein YajG
MKRILTSLLLVMSLGACALTVDEVNLDYKSRTAAAAVGGADGIQVSVSTNDVRQSNKDRISVKKNGYGMEMAAIVTKQDVPAIVTRAIEDELTSRGFRLGKGPVFVLVDISKFSSDFKTGFFSGKAVGEVMLNTQVRNADGRLVYSKGYAGEHTVEDIQLASGTNAKAAVEGAFSAAVGQMVADPYFLQSLIEAKRAMPAAKPTS